jgi:hypothetical protein
MGDLNSTKAKANFSSAIDVVCQHGIIHQIAIMYQLTFKFRCILSQTDVLNLAIVLEKATNLLF